jgi:hypothetical protein
LKDGQTIRALVISISLVAAIWLGDLSPLRAETLRIASFHTELSRDGPGLLFSDILSGQDVQVAAVIETLIAADADILTLQGIDYDLENRAIGVLADALATAGAPYPHLFSAAPNAGLATDLDLDGDGRPGGPGDAQGFGYFYGQGGMAVLSRFPIDTAGVADFTELLWRDLPGALLPETEAGPFPSAEALRIQRLFPNGAWAVPIEHPGYGTVTVLTFHAGPPVFDGSEDRNGKRNHDELMFWQHYLSGTFGPAPSETYILSGNANLDPERSDGRHDAIRHFLTHPMLQDPLPDRPTVNWQNTGEMRVSYILPSRDWTVTEAGILPPNPEASRHSLIWVDLTR